MVWLVKPTPLRRLLAAVALFVSTVAVGPATGHAHADGASYHVHHGRGHRVADQHEHHHAHSDVTLPARSDGDDHPPSVADSQFHLHAMLLGVAVTLPVPADSREEHERHSLPELVFVSAVPRDYLSPTGDLERHILPDASGHVSSVPVTPVSHSVGLQHSPPGVSELCLQHPCALQAQSGVLRC